MSVGGGCMSPWRPRPPTQPPPLGWWWCRGGGARRRRRISNTAGRCRLIRLELDVSDEHIRRRLERHWGAVFRLRRALQRDAQHRCRETAAWIVAAHGAVFTIEDCTISTWARLWGKRIALFSPGMLLAELAGECAASGGRLHRAATRSTALSHRAGSEYPKPWRSAPMIARPAGCALTATSSRRR
jgi:hypothetical protein